jgi:hypothetical protein
MQPIAIESEAMRTSRQSRVPSIIQITVKINLRLLPCVLPCPVSCLPASRRYYFVRLFNIKMSISFQRTNYYRRIVIIIMSSKDMTEIFLSYLIRLVCPSSPYDYDINITHFKYDTYL